MKLLLKTLLFSVSIAIVGYILFPYLPFAEAEPQLIFVIALLLGGVSVSLIANNFNLEFSDSVDSDEEGQTLYVGNLAYKVNEGQVRELFSAYGQVNSIRLMRDRKTGKRKGYGFVEMNKSGAKKAVKALNDTEFAERTLKIREANERGERDE